MENGAPLSSGFRVHPNVVCRDTDPHSFVAEPRLTMVAGIQFPTMARKSKRKTGSLPMTHHERSRLEDRGSGRLAEHYQLGLCGIGLTTLADDAAVCSPSGHLYDKQAMLEYLITQKQILQEQRDAYDKQQEDLEKQQSAAETKAHNAKVEQFTQAQSVLKDKKRKRADVEAQKDLQRTSYWLAEAQPSTDLAEAALAPPPERPLSPYSQQPLQRSNLWPVRLVRVDDTVVCAVSHQPIRTRASRVYWTDKKQPGTVVLQSVWDDVLKGRCPETSQKIRHSRVLQGSGKSMAKESKG